MQVVLWVSAVVVGGLFAGFALWLGTNARNDKVAIVGVGICGLLAWFGATLLVRTLMFLKAGV